MIDRLHPNPYQFKDKAFFLHQYNSLEKRIDKLDKREFAMELARLNAFLHCSHSKIRIPGEYINFIGKQSVFFPEPLSINAKLELIYKPGKSRKLTKLLSINEIPSDDIVRKLLKYSSYDGHNHLFALSKLNDAMPLALYFLFGPLPSFKIKAFNVSGNIETFSIKAKSLIDILQTYPEEKSKQFKAIRVFIFKSKSLAMIKIRSFVLDQKGFDHEMTRVFGGLKQLNINHLVIDLRDNEGGDIHNASILYSYLAQKNQRFEFDAYVKKTWQYGKENLVAINGRRANKKTYNDLVDYMNINFKSSKMKDLFLESSKLSFNRMITPKPNVFRGDVSLLINSNSRSTASLFAAFFKSRRRGLIFGKQSGGYALSHNGNIMLTFKLHHSGLIVELPLVYLKYKFLDQLAIEEGFKGTLGGVKPDIFLSQVDTKSKSSESIDMSVQKVIAYIFRSTKQNIKQFDGAAGELDLPH